MAIDRFSMLQRMGPQPCIYKLSVLSGLYGEKHEIERKAYLGIMEGGRGVDIIFHVYAFKSSEVKK